MRATVGEAVRKRLVADVPLGALLSGGIDSSIVVALMAQASSQPVRTFTVGFPDARYDERTYARAVASQYGTVHEEVEIEEDIASTLPRLAATFDEPLGDEAAFPTFLIAEQARRHVTVALAGDGGDEAFAGYERYIAHRLAERIPGRAGTGRRSGVAPSSGCPAGAAVAALPRGALPRRCGDARRPERYARLMEVFPVELRRELWSDARQAQQVRLEPSRPGVTGLQLLDIETYLPGDLLLKADLASMAHSLELRSPFLDHEVVALGLALPGLAEDTRPARERSRCGGRSRRTSPPRSPAAARRGFGVPLGRWFRRTCATRRTISSPVTAAGSVPRHRARLLDEHESGRADHGHRLWCLLMLELWVREHVEAPVLVAAA